jgi:hypothetical protein
MPCPQHGNMPSPLRPDWCPWCYPPNGSHPPRLSDLMPSASMAQSQASTEVLSDLAGALRTQLAEAREEVRTQAALVESLRAELAGLKRELRSAKRDAREGRDLLMTCEAEKRVILDAMERMTEAGRDR